MGRHRSNSNHNAKARTLTRLAAAAALATMLTGCAPSLRGPAARPAEGLLTPRQVERAAADSAAFGHNPALVFEHTSVATFYARTPNTIHPESIRRDAALGASPRPIPETAPNRSLDRARRTTLPRTARQLILF
ncbi:MAG: hypothetical protein AAF297_04865 [Planctomycetota bacterium]